MQIIKLHGNSNQESCGSNNSFICPITAKENQHNSLTSRIFKSNSLTLCMVQVFFFIFFILYIYIYIKNKNKNTKHMAAHMAI